MISVWNNDTIIIMNIKRQMLLPQPDLLNHLSFPMMSLSFVCTSTYRSPFSDAIFSAIVAFGSAWPPRVVRTCASTLNMCHTLEALVCHVANTTFVADMVCSSSV